MSSEQSRKVLEDIQRAKSKLLKDGAAASLGIAYVSSPSSSSSSIGPLSSSPGLSPGVLSGDVHLSPAQRSAMQVLQQATLTSFGYFVTQESHFGNSILPVLPRIDPATASISGGGSGMSSSSSLSSPIKTEK